MSSVFIIMKCVMWRRDLEIVESWGEFDGKRILHTCWFVRGRYANAEVLYTVYLFIVHQDSNLKLVLNEYACFYIAWIRVSCLKLLHLQVEPVAVACLIRIFLRYIVEVEGMTTKGFTKVQNSCYIKTLEVHYLVEYCNIFILHIIYCIVQVTILSYCSVCYAWML